MNWIPFSFSHLLLRLRLRSILVSPLRLLLSFDIVRVIALVLAFVIAHGRARARVCDRARVVMRIRLLRRQAEPGVRLRTYTENIGSGSVPTNSCAYGCSSLLFHHVVYRVADITRLYEHVPPSCIS